MVTINVCWNFVIEHLFLRLVASPELMGCSPNNNEMSKFIKYLEILNSKIYTLEMDLGKSNKWLQDKYLNNEIIYKRFFTKTKNSNEKLRFC